MTFSDCLVASGSMKVECWSSQTEVRGSVKSDDLRGSNPSFQEKKMLERLGLVLLASVLAFAFAPYFYALGGL
jgi:hypothetical protein